MKCYSTLSSSPPDKTVLGVDGMIILKCILVKLWTAFNWLMVSSDGGLL